ncbi:UDP-N-acetylmuramoyl-L-alanyl-D-glutamate--2,6-diaminopimelate ligase [uncultured Salinisphaera sp.]|uniref:UDP-N-acetylmuramoyl-L-alanyl-D-glutamate--2, 6-diaminopimelate ligase n=1 Tax=uncultured Salinisphaera sp. TaxID=359372 RepID=UPI0032B30EB7
MNGLAPVSTKARPLASLLDGLACDVPGVDIAGVAIDSRRVQPGSLFLAYRGTQSHGLDHVDAAVAAGAVAVAWDDAQPPMLNVPSVRVEALASRASRIAGRFYDEPSQKLFVAGVTGTDGKTSCAWLLSQALELLGARCGYIGTLGFGFADDLAEATHTTPDPVAVQDWLARLAAADASAVAFEVSSHALDQHRVDGVAFDVAVLTQLGRDHLDYHASLEAYAAAKQRLFAFDGLSSAVLNGDDAYGREWLAALAADVTPIAYGCGDMAALADNYVRIESVATRVDGLSLTLDTSWGRAVIDSVLVGRFNAMNLAAVLAVLLARGVDFDAATAVLAQLTTVPGRMQRVDTRDDQPMVVVDYAHTPGALAHAIAAVREHAAARVLCVFGCGGDRDAGKRPLMGAAAEAADAVWLTDDNPRSESPAAIVAAISAGMQGDTPVTIEHDRAAAIADAIHAARPGDVVLIAGKGHETTQQIGATRRIFDDRLAAHDALEAL